MGRRKQEGSRAEISDRVKDLVAKAKAQHFGKAAAPKPVATACRSSTPPPMLAKASSTPPPPDSPAPMSTTESPPLTQPVKRLRSVQSEIGSEATSAAPTLPSFAASSYKHATPHHSDSQTTICADLEKLKLSGLQPIKDLLLLNNISSMGSVGRGGCSHFPQDTTPKTCPVCWRSDSRLTAYISN